MTRVIDASLIAKLKWERLDLWCTPHILVVTDMGYDPNIGFSLSQFVDTLKGNQVLGKAPKVTTANTGMDAAADIENFTFDNPTTGLKKSRYDVCFIFALGSAPAISDAELTAIEQFMEAGAACSPPAITRRSAPASARTSPACATCASGSTTCRAQGAWTGSRPTCPGADRIYEFVDQSDVYPQRLYLNWRTEAGGVGQPHPIMQTKAGNAVDWIPDHPHEGECLVPRNLTTTFDLNGTTVDEWPEEPFTNNRVSPEAVALSMSHGDAFPGKAALTPRSFIAIAAYDGHRTNVGRVITDATWHHFININIDGAGSSREGLMPGGVDTTEMAEIREHWVNMAVWLMPKKRRRCRFLPILVKELELYPLRETIPVPDPGDPFTEEAAFEVGLQVRAALESRLPKFQVDQFLDDAVEIGVGDGRRFAQLRELSSQFGEASAERIGTAALGAQTLTVLRTATEKSLSEFGDPEELLPTLEGAAKASVRRESGRLAERLNRTLRLFSSIERSDNEKRE